VHQERELEGADNMLIQSTAFDTKFSSEARKFSIFTYISTISGKSQAYFENQSFEVSKFRKLETQQGSFRIRYYITKNMRSTLTITVDRGM